MFEVGLEFFLSGRKFAVEEEVGREGEPFVFQAGAGGEATLGFDNEHLFD